MIMQRGSRNPRTAGYIHDITFLLKPLERKNAVERRRFFYFPRAAIIFCAFFCREPTVQFTVISAYFS